MAHTQYSLYTLVIILSSLLNISCSSHTPHVASKWAPAVSTWVGDGGFNDGACGYGGAVRKSPIHGFFASGGPYLYKSGLGCGGCYQVRCTNHSMCSGKPVTVTITDECPACSEGVHFHMSETAFGAMAKHGHAQQLLLAGGEDNVPPFPIHYRRVDCNHRGLNIVLRVDPRSVLSNLLLAVEVENKEVHIKKVDLKQGKYWYRMDSLGGGKWYFVAGDPLSGPMTFNLTTPAGNTITAKNVIPKDWQPGSVYRAIVNF